MTTSMHIRGGLILWREVLESSSRREGPPRPTRGYSLSRRFGTREIATWTEGLFCEVEADLSSKLERLRIPGLSRKIYCALSPQRLSLLPYRDFFCRCCALRGPPVRSGIPRPVERSPEMRRDGFCARPRCRFCARLKMGFTAFLPR